MIDLIVQNTSTYEVRSVIHAVSLSDEYKIIRCDISDVSKHTGIPIGSVEFVREYMITHNIQEPIINPYPVTDWKFLKRNIHKRIGLNGYTLYDKFFVKPCKLKLFNGFVYDPDKINEFATEQLKILSSYPEEPLWISNVVEFISEWRFYIQDNQILGYARYDERDEETSLPDINLINEYIQRLDLKHPYVLDFGILSTGETALVEYNDAWAIGLYYESLSPKQYLSFLVKRWETIEKGN